MIDLTCVSIMIIMYCDEIKPLQHQFQVQLAVPFLFIVLTAVLFFTSKKSVCLGFNFGTFLSMSASAANSVFIKNFVPVEGAASAVFLNESCS